ncbi:MAG TPA: hypothetical protein VKR05_06020 [Candidatus Cybelea sp.]|nr:hypothetical protein [Candidatus Cybelea sp.]
MRKNHAVAVVRDMIEIVAIVAAGVWAFYVFAYENRIKPAMASPDVDVKASMTRLGEHNGLIAVNLHLQLQNVSSVNAHFLGLAVNVYGQRIVASNSPLFERPASSRYNFRGFFRAEPRVPVYGYAYVTNLGDPSSTQDTKLDPGNTIANDYTFYVPKGRFDLLTLGVQFPYTKFDDAGIPAHLAVTAQGEAHVVTTLSSKIDQYYVAPVTSLDVR